MTKKPDKTHQGHLVLDPVDMRHYLTLLLNQLELVEYDAVAFCGMGGALIAGVVAFGDHKAMLLVRKKGEAKISVAGRKDCMVEGPRRGIRRYVIVDDAMESGDTVRHVVAEVKKTHPKAECVGVFLYAQPFPYEQPHRGVTRATIPYTLKEILEMK